MKLKVYMVLTLSIALFMAACGGKSDADLQKAANDKLTADQITGVTVAVKDGVANLTGEVADVTVKSRAETSIRSVEGIKSVTSAGVTTKPLATPPPVSADRMLEGTINESLRKKGITGVTVAAVNGEVTLTGTVDKAKIPEVMMAANEAKPAKVVNNLNK